MQHNDESIQTVFNFTDIQRGDWVCNKVTSSSGKPIFTFTTPTGSKLSFRFSDDAPWSLRSYKTNVLAYDGSDASTSGDAYVRAENGAYRNFYSQCIRAIRELSTESKLSDQDDTRIPSVYAPTLPIHERKIRDLSEKSLPVLSAFLFTLNYGYAFTDEEGKLIIGLKWSLSFPSTKRNVGPVESAHILLSGGVRNRTAENKEENIIQTRSKRTRKN